MIMLYVVEKMQYNAVLIISGSSYLRSSWNIGRGCSGLYAGLQCWSNTRRGRWLHTRLIGWLKKRIKQRYPFHGMRGKLRNSLREDEYPKDSHHLHW